MGNYIVSARKYRPTTFDSVVGQRALTTTLKNAIAQGKLAHAYLFCGPRGVGKTTCARIFAKSINCLNPTAEGDACNECESCRAFNEQRSYNIHELDAASNNSVDDIRELIEQVQIPPQIGHYKVFIIDEVHMLSPAAFNAFLKTLEEPPAHVIFILATTEKHKILPTILSRCQIYNFNRITVTDAANHLAYVAEKEGITFEKEALHVIAEKADGGMRDALSIFDQVASFCEGNITYQKVIENLNVLDYDEYFAMTDSLLQHDVPAVMLRLDKILGKGFEANYFMGGLASHFRNLLVSRDSQTLPLLDVSEQVRQRYHDQSMRCNVKLLYRALRLCNDCDINYRTARNKRLLVELTLIEVSQINNEDDSAGCGLGPTKCLKPIFKQTAPTNSQAVQPTTQHNGNEQQSSTSAPTATPLQAVQTAQQTLQELVTQNQHKTVKPARTLSLRALQNNYIKATNEAQSEEKSVVAEQQSQSLSEVSTTNKQFATPFTQENLLYYWLRFANQLPLEKSAVASRMKNMIPKLQDNWGIQITVENEMVEHYFLDLKISIQNYLRTHLHNDLISIYLQIASNDETPRFLSRKEQFSDMMQRNEALQLLSKNLDLKLA